jgi:Rrf2 family nitric oxide-sensitive transcriptional repressor
MQLTLHTDYALRVLLYLAHFPDRRIGTEEISIAYGISKNHLVRVVQTLAEHGYVRVSVGRTGGIELGADPATVRLGDVVKNCEPSFRLVECHDEVNNTCPIVPVCRLRGLLDAALDDFMAKLNQFTLAALVKERSKDRFIQLVGK